MITELWLEVDGALSPRASLSRPCQRPKSWFAIAVVTKDGSTKEEECDGRKKVKGEEEVSQRMRMIW